jgi:hypothetical protein
MIYSKMIIRKCNQFLLLILLEARIAHKLNYLSKVINFKANSPNLLKIIKIMMIRFIEQRVKLELIWIKNLLDCLLFQAKHRLLKER